MAGAFGFQNYGSQRKTPSSEAVGRALMQQGQGAGQPGGEMAMGPGSMDPAMMAPPDDSALRADGAQRMTGGGQIDDNADPDDGFHSANAVNVAIGEALTRLGGGYTTNPNQFKDRERHMRLLQQHGLSATEAQLLVRSGGV